MVGNTVIPTEKCNCNCRINWKLKTTTWFTLKNVLQWKNNVWLSRLCNEKRSTHVYLHFCFVRKVLVVKEQFFSEVDKLKSQFWNDYQSEDLQKWCIKRNDCTKCRRKESLFIHQTVQNGMKQKDTLRSAAVPILRRLWHSLDLVWSKYVPYLEPWRIGDNSWTAEKWWNLKTVLN